MEKPTQVQTLRRMLAVNGPLWTLYVASYVGGRKINKDLQLPWLDQRIKNLETKKNLPGMNASELQHLIWEAWDWDAEQGEEWTQSEEWKSSVVDDVLIPWVPAQRDVLEIGPGAGRWTEALAPICKSLTLVDISERCIEICREKFGDLDHVTFHVTTGSDLSFIESSSLDVIWSFDVFVHIAPDDVERYVAEFARILRPGGRAIIHHAAEGGLHGGWRSSVTAEMFATFATANGFELVEQFDAWGDNRQFDVHRYHDTVSVIEKPMKDTDG